MKIKKGKEKENMAYACIYIVKKRESIKIKNHSRKGKRKRDIKREKHTIDSTKWLCYLLLMTVNRVFHFSFPIFHKSYSLVCGK
jgi:hypothetical protein